MTCLIPLSHPGLWSADDWAKLFLRTCFVHCSSCPCAGTAIRSTEPRIMLPAYWSPSQLSGGRGLSTPQQRFGPAKEPLVLTTTSFLHSGVTLASAGIQVDG